MRQLFTGRGFRFTEPMPSIKARGIVLKRWSFGEADRVLTLLTPGLGKISAIAKGARRPTSALAGHVELFTVADFVFAEGRTWYIVTAAETVRPFQSTSLDVAQSAGYVSRLVDRVTQAHEESSPQVFEILERTLQSLLVGAGPLAVRQFEWQLLLAIGSQPELGKCSHCGGGLSETQLGLCPERGGALCPACLQLEAVHVPITAGTLKVLRLFERASVVLASRLNLAPEVTSELGRVTRAFLEATLEQAIVQPVDVPALQPVG